jgi:hypothetical protein
MVMLDTATAVTTLRLMNDLRVMLLDMGSLFIFSIGCSTYDLRGSQEIDILGRGDIPTNQTTQERNPAWFEG